MKVDLVQLQRQSEQISPDARVNERRAVLERLSLQPQHIVCDVPAWGGYFARGVENPSRVICLDPDVAMVRCPGAKVIAAAPVRLPLPTASVDRVASLVGMHHQPAQIRSLFMLEIARILRPTGVVVMSEVLEGSPVAAFLNEDVDKFSERGHKGTFFAVGGLKVAMQAAGLTNVTEETVNLVWRFRTQPEMVSYCKTLFAMTKATDVDVLTALHKRFAIVVEDGLTCLPWTLLYGVGTKG
jgi:SAM-dependent methyltransferase